MTHRSGGLGVAGLLLGSILVIAGCTGSSAVSTPSQPASLAPATQAAPASPSPASPSPAAPSQASAALPSPSSANCVERTTFDLLRNTRDYSELTQPQVDELVAALTAFDYGSDTTGAQWRDQFVAALKSGDLHGAQQLASALAMGQGYGEPKPCP